MTRLECAKLTLEVANMDFRRTKKLDLGGHNTSSEPFAPLQILRNLCSHYHKKQLGESDLFGKMSYKTFPADSQQNYAICLIFSDNQISIIIACQFIDRVQS